MEIGKPVLQYKGKKGKTEGLKMLTSTSTVMIIFVSGDLKY